MAIDTNKYFFNKALHIEVATELNALANSKGVQVSRWVNNSKGRQVITYIVHRGERADRAVDQADVLFKTSVDAGRGGRVYDETGMMREVRQYLDSLVADGAIEGFYYSDDDTIAGEPQFALDVNEQYEAYLASLGDEATDTPEQFEERWKYITSDDFDDPLFLNNMQTELKFVYFDEIRTFIETELAKREAANV